MRVLKFIVNEQIIEKDPTCDFNDLIPGSEGHLFAEFSFSRHWDDCIKVAAFYSPLGYEYEPQVLKDGKTCMIPADALKRSVFKVRVIGKKQVLKLTTNKVTVNQKGG